jgi:hypothetical protein
MGAITKRITYHPMSFEIDLNELGATGERPVGTTVKTIPGHDWPGYQLIQRQDG